MMITEVGSAQQRGSGFLDKECGEDVEWRTGDTRSLVASLRPADAGVANVGMTLGREAGEVME